MKNLTTATDLTLAAVSLPPELWGMVIKCLSKEDIRSFCSVCRLFRDLTHPVLFSHVTLRFGLWRPADGGSAEEDNMDHDAGSAEEENMDHDTQLTDEEVSELKRSQRRTCELLLHVVRTPSFAQLVRKLSVRAYFVDDRDGMFELYTLKEALLSMTGITSFRWEGRRPILQSFILDALAQSSGHVLRELILPYSNASQMCLTPFERLESLTLRCPLDDYSYGVVSEDPKPLVIEGLETITGPLTRLTVYAMDTWIWPVHSLRHLQELELLLPISADEFGTILQEFSVLQALTLDLGTTTFASQAFQAHPDALPHLAAFKLLRGYFYGGASVPVARFLQNKKSLRRLDIDCGGYADAQGAAAGSGGFPLSILQVVAHGLPALEVLGLTVFRTRLEAADISVLGRHIPLSRVTALMIRFEVGVDLGYGSSEWIPEWDSMIAKLSALRYLHVFDYSGCKALKDRLVEHRPRSLELYGIGSDMRWLAPRGVSEDMNMDSSGGSTAKDSGSSSPPWPLSKVRFRTADDFGCADWEWLFRHHQLDALEMSR